MVLVVLPLGTFRTLHALLRPKAAIRAHNVVAAPRSGRKLQRDQRPAICRVTPGFPDRKLKFRNWADVTFLETESPQLSDVWVDCCPSTSLDRPQAPGRAAVESVSPWRARGTPREAIIAACTLVI